MTYPFRSFDGMTVDRQRSGQRVYDINVDGMAHYGLFPDWVEDLRLLAGQEVVDDLGRGAEPTCRCGSAPSACPRPAASPGGHGRHAAASAACACGRAQRPSSAARGSRAGAPAGPGGGAELPHDSRRAAAWLRSAAPRPVIVRWARGRVRWVGATIVR